MVLGRICTSYIVTTLLLTLFIYFLLSMGMRNTRQITRLREEMDDIMHAVHQDLLEKSSKCYNAPQPVGQQTKTTCSSGIDNREINSLVDTFVKRKLYNIMDDLYNIKKQITGSTCNLFGTGTGTSCNTNVPRASRVNYASEDLGARVVHVDAEPVDGTNLLKTLLGLDFSANPPVSILKASLEPGSCFAFKGSKAGILLELAREIIVDSIILTHVSKEMTPGLCSNSAPKLFSVYGLPRECNGDINRKVPCGQFQYDNLPRKRSQEFAIKQIQKFSMLYIQIQSNHGNPNHTCIYRVEVHGRLN